MPGEDAERAIVRMRRYTTGSLVVMVGIYALISASAMEHVVTQVGAVVASIATMVLVYFWEEGAPRWIAILAAVVTTTVWTIAVVLRDQPFPALMVSVCLAMLLTQTARIRWTVVPLGVVPVLAPLVIVAISSTEETSTWVRYGWFGVIAYIASVTLFVVNRYGWNRYLEIDAARRTGEELAVAQERYRFAADLHDIQGHTLHVLRLKIQLADRLIDRDPDAAHTHLAEAQMLIAETVANTRSLAFGDRHVAVASELANARELFGAAGIDCVVHGEVSTHGQEELFGLVVREVTTNILRHSQATAVTVRLGDGLVVITNDGSPEDDVKLSGLARLSDRFAAAGGTLTASTHGGRFTTEALIPNAAILSSTGSRGRAAL